MSDLTAYQDAFHSAALSISLTNRYANVASGQGSPITLNAAPGLNVMAGMLEASVALTATGAVSAVANSDILDEWFSQLEIQPAPGTPDRLHVKSRIGAEELERLVFDTAQGWSSGDIAAQSSHIGSYSRSAQAAFTTAGTRTDTSELWFPGGGASLTVVLTIGSITAAYASAVTAAYTIGYFAVLSVYSGVVVAFENKANTMGAGNNQDLMAQGIYPSGLAADMVSFLSQSTTNITQIYMTDAYGRKVINMDDVQSLAATPYVYPRFATNSPTYTSMVFQLNKTIPSSISVSLANSTTITALWIQVQGPEVAPANEQGATVTTPEVSRTGVPGPTAGPKTAPVGQGAGGASSPAAIANRSSNAALVTIKGITPRWS